MPGSQALLRDFTRPARAGTASLPISDRDFQFVGTAPPATSTPDGTACRTAIKPLRSFSPRQSHRQAELLDLEGNSSIPYLTIWA